MKVRKKGIDLQEPSDSIMKTSGLASELDKIHVTHSVEFWKLDPTASVKFDKISLRLDIFAQVQFSHAAVLRMRGSRLAHGGCNHSGKDSFHPLLQLHILSYGSEGRE